MSEALSSGIQSIAAESGRAMGSASKSAGSSEDGGMNELYKVNQVWYRLPPTLSLVAKRTLLVNNALNLSYLQNTFNQQITFIFNTGEYYVNMPSSYLYMEIGYNSTVRDYLPNINSAGAYNWAKALISQGNAMSLFEEVAFTSASGTEICREQNKGLEASVRFRYENCQEYINTIGQVQGAAYGPYSEIYDANAPVFDQSLGGDPRFNAWAQLAPIGGSNSLITPRSGASQTYFGTRVTNINNTSYKVTPSFVPVCIPMDQVIGCFKPYMQTLYPAGALAGGRLDLRLKDPTESLQFIAGCVENSAGTSAGTVDPNNSYLQNLLNNRVSGFQINKIYMVLDAFQMQDNVLKRLNQVSAGQDGLSVLFDTYDHTVQTPAGSGAFEMQVQQARSRIVRSYCVVRDNANTSNPFINSLASEAAVTRVCQSCPPGFLNVYPQNPIATGNDTGWDGSLQFLTVASQNDAKVPNTTGGPTWNSLTQEVGTTSSFTNPYVYSFLVRPRMPGNPASDNNTASTTSSVFSSSMPTVGSYQAQLGSLFFPQQPLTTAAEYYQNAMYIWGKGVPDKCDTCSVTYEDFLGGLGWGLYDPTTNPSGGTNIVPSLVWPPPTVNPQVGVTPNPNARSGNNNNPTCNSIYGHWISPYGLAIYGMLAEKSSALQLSGLPISNARLLRHKLYFNQAPLSQDKRTVSAFTQFTRVMKVYLGGRVVVRE